MPIGLGESDEQVRRTIAIAQRMLDTASVGRLSDMSPEHRVLPAPLKMYGMIEQHVNSQIPARCFRYVFRCILRISGLTRLVVYHIHCGHAL